MGLFNRKKEKAVAPPEILSRQWKKEYKAAQKEQIEREPEMARRRSFSKSVWAAHSLKEKVAKDPSLQSYFDNSEECVPGTASWEQKINIEKSYDKFSQPVMSFPYGDYELSAGYSAGWSDDDGGGRPGQVLPIEVKLGGIDVSDEHLEVITKELSPMIDQGVELGNEMIGMHERNLELGRIESEEKAFRSRPKFDDPEEIQDIQEIQDQRSSPEQNHDWS